LTLFAAFFPRFNVPESPASATIARMIHHVTREIPPEKLTDCLSFYALLGFQTVPAPPALVGRAVWLARSPDGSGDQIHLLPLVDVEPATGHFALVCPDYEATLARLHDAGHTSDPLPAHWGSPRVTVRDPAGSQIELMQWPPGTAS
jgi:hypothetical protein